MSAAHPQVLLDYFARIDAEVLNFRRAMVKIKKGAYYIERAIIKVLSSGDIECSVRDLLPTEREAIEIKRALANVEFPRTIGARTSEGLVSGGLVGPGPLYEFWDRATGGIVMVQERRDNPKRHLPWVFLSDGTWAQMEPDGPLPFWKPKVGRGPGARIMIHEGAKAAYWADRWPTVLKGHPWAKEFQEYEHWGMIGGALAPHRSDYESLRREAPSEVVYVCDNDHPGMEALKGASKGWRGSMKGVVFGDKFPPSWDCADAMPANLFSGSGRYVGPTLKSLMVPATWATELSPNPAGKGRPIAGIRTEFSQEWLHCVQPEVFIHRDFPHRTLMAKEFDNQVSPFSDLKETSTLLKKEFAGKAAVLRYVPGERSGVYAGEAAGLGLYINTWCKSRVEPETGDAAPWLDFMEHLIPLEGDRREALRWVATLVARPDVRMLYGMLLISETQGIGKGTLGEKILAPLVGEINVSYPSEQEIVESQYNYWLAHKRLAVVHEIYAGSSSKAYNKLKSAITDRMVTVQRKYMANYELENWVHVFACSNSMRAMKLSMDDRRWFVPRLTEEKRPAAYWEGLNRWLTQDGGLAAIAGWAGDCVARGEMVMTGVDAPWSTLKRTIVEEGYSPGQAIVARELERIRDAVVAGEMAIEDAFCVDQDLVRLIRDELYDGRMNEKLERPATVRGVAKAMGWTVGEGKVGKGWGPVACGGRLVALDAGVAAMGPAALAEAGRRPVRMEVGV